VANDFTDFVECAVVAPDGKVRVPEEAAYKGDALKADGYFFLKEGSTKDHTASKCPKCWSALAYWKQCTSASSLDLRSEPSEI
jgi:hypothetical protein